jgi:hypothetical protein
MSGRRRSLFTLPSPALVVASIALVIAVGGAAFAAIPGPDGTVKTCYTNATGALRVIDSAATCNSVETELLINQTGPVGPPGVAGAAGPKGDPGAAATVPPLPFGDGKPSKAELPKGLTLPPKKPGPQVVKQLKGKGGVAGEPTAAYQSVISTKRTTLDNDAAQTGDTTIAHVFVPAGRYVVTGEVTGGTSFTIGGLTVLIYCTLVAAKDTLDDGWIDPYQVQTTLTGTATVKSPSRIDMRCYTPKLFSFDGTTPPPGDIASAKLTAISVAHVTVTKG